MTNLSAPDERFTVFSDRQKIFLTIFLSLTNLASPLAATSYVPLLPLLSRLFYTSLEAINLSVTVYVIFQAISPSLFAPYADVHGRRPVFFITYCLFTLGSLGLALNGTKSFSGLLVLRALQSLGTSAVLSLSYGVVADVATPSERGNMSAETHTHFSMCLTLQAVLGLLCMLLNIVSQALLIAIFPENSSAAAATGNLARCSLTAIIISVLQPGLDKMGRGWYFTLLGLLSDLGGIVVVLLVRSRGLQWRTERTKGSQGAESPNGPRGSNTDVLDTKPSLDRMKDNQSQEVCDTEKAP